MKKKNGYIIAILSVMVLLVGGLAFKSVYAYFGAKSSASGSITMGHLYIDNIEPSDSTSTGWNITNLQSNQSFGGSYKVQVTSDINYYTRILFKASVTPYSGKTHADGCGDNVADPTDILDISIDGNYSKSNAKTNDGYTAYYKLTPTTVESETTIETFNIDLKVADWVGSGYCDYYMGATVSINMYVQVMQADYLESNGVGGTVSAVDDMHDLWSAGGIETPILDVSEHTNLTFTVLSSTNKTMSVKMANTSITTANIPANVKKNGEVYTVTQIAQRGFYNCTNLNSVTIPNTVTSIGMYAFRSCTSLTSMTIPNSVTSIGSATFMECSNLTSLTISESVVSIGTVAFQGSGLTSINIPNSVTSIGAGAFKSCFSLTAIDVGSEDMAYSSIEGVLFNKDTTTLIKCPQAKQGDYTVPNGVTSMTAGGMGASDDGAFQTCWLLTSITIPSSVISIGTCAFYACFGLTAINVDISNTEYSSIDGVLFNKNATELMVCPAGKTGGYTIPNGVTIIEAYAFYNCSNLTSITMVNSVTSIGYNAFDSCAGLSSITISSGVISIGSSAFSGCTNLTSVIFGNTTGWHLDSATGTSIDVTDPSANATNLTSSVWMYKDLYRA